MPRELVYPFSLLLGEPLHIITYGGHHDLHEYNDLFEVNVGEAFLVKLEGDGSGSSIKLSRWSDLIRKIETVFRSDRVSKPCELRYAEEISNFVLVDPAFEQTQNTLGVGRCRT